MKRIWIDTDIGTNPDDATALIFALKHPELDVAGISISGSHQRARRQEAQEVLSYVNAARPEIYLGEELTSDIINREEIHATVALGPLTNIARLVLDEAQLGHIHAMAGSFGAFMYRGQMTSTENNVGKDLDSARVALTQHDEMTICPVEVAEKLTLNADTKDAIEQRHNFLKARYDGYTRTAQNKYPGDNGNICLADVLALCDVINTPTIVRETIEFTIQANGSFYSPRRLNWVAMQNTQDFENPQGLPEPTVKHQVVTAIDPEEVFKELLAVL